MTCKLNNVNPYEWIKYVLNQDLNEMPINQFKNILSHNWTNTPKENL
ncbi:transposase domain-containing protein [Chitinophaga sp. 30R24]